VNTVDNLAIRESALSAIGLPSTAALSGISISACVMATRRPGPAARVDIGRRLAEKTRTAASEKLDGRLPTGIIEARVESSDEASCEDQPGGRVLSAFIDGTRCYRIEIRVVTDE
jgi:hypothetical protein